MPNVTTQDLHPIHDYDPDENLQTRFVLAEWVELFLLEGERRAERWNLLHWIEELSLRDRRLTALTARRDDVLGDRGAWLTNDAQHALIDSWVGGDEDAMNAWFDAFMAAIDEER